MNQLENMSKRGIIPKVVLYARFSSDNQREESIDAQLRAMREYSKRGGAVIVGEYIDRAKSATTDDRPQFLNMIVDAKSHTFDFVIVHKLDRFSRNRYDSAFYKRELKKQGVSLLSVLENLDDSPESIILESVLEGMGEYYSKNLSREVKKGMRESALQCLATGGVPPYGLSVDTKTRKYIINPNEAPAIKYIFNEVANGKGYVKIIKELNDMGYRTRKGKPFGKNSIHEILRNEKYKGTYIFNRSSEKDYNGKRNNHRNKNDDDIIRIENAIEPIIDPETFDIVSKIIATRRRTTPINAKENYLLSGKVFCGECGSAMSGNRKHSGRNKTLYVTYRCGSYNLKGGLDCDNKEINKQKLEAFVLKELSRSIFNDDTLNSIINEYEQFCKNCDSEETEKIKLINKKLLSVKAKINNLIDIMADSGSKNVLAKLTTLEQEQEQLETELAKYQLNLDYPKITNEQIKSAYEKARDLFVSGELKDRQTLINNYLNKVLVYKEHIEVYLNRLPTYLLFLDHNLFIRNQKNIKKVECKTTLPQK